MNIIRLHIIICFCLWANTLLGQHTISGTVLSSSDIPIENADIYEHTQGLLLSSNDKGKFSFENLSNGTYYITIFSFEYNTYEDTIVISNSDKVVSYNLSSLSNALSAVEISARRKEIFALKRLKSVEGTAIYEGKKTEVVLLDQIVGNLAANNARQIYAQVAGLNIYENNDAGLQLHIGGRGLDPNRTANFNTRQNGYDISADVLGYPESYYSPPAEAIDQIQVVRGAASLQYGTQFGGLINFKLKKPSAKVPFHLRAQQTLGSFGLLTSYVEAGGIKNKLSYFGYYNYKHGDGYRPNSRFNSHNGYAYVAYSFSPYSTLSLESTYMHYLAQQPGGLTDSQFAENSRVSNRARNWFEVDWLLYSLKWKHQLSKKSTFSFTLFGLDAERNTIGFRGNPSNLNSNPITDLDEQSIDGTYVNPRDIIKGNFNNWGFESRFLHQYTLGNQLATALIGAKYYKANNSSFQGPGTIDTDADFNIINTDFPDYPNVSNFNFPNENIALFGEHILKLSDKLSVTPGIRLEYIKTQSQGVYNRVIFDNAGNAISNIETADNNDLSRSFALLGIGISYKPSRTLETYGNISQNYRSVTFSDIRTVSPTFIIDPNISDERGFTSDIGMRGRIGNKLSFDASLFSVLYDNRIGIVLDDRANRVRKNIGTAFIYGLETFIEWNISKTIYSQNTDSKFTVFANTSFTQSRYISSDENNVKNNKVEFIPLVNLKTGVQFGYKNWLGSMQFTYLDKQFTDAQNSEAATVGDLKEGIIGIIPSYGVLDFSASYKYKSILISSGVLNLLDKSYYTRRAIGYPGPGIIPSDGRSLYLTLSFEL